MADLSDRGRSNRRQGHQHERDVVGYLRRWFPNARRQLHAHNADIEGTGPLSIECKYTGWQAIPAAVDQAKADAARRGLARGVVIKKRQGIADIGKAFWIGTVATELAAAVRLIELEQEVLQLRRQLADRGHQSGQGTGRTRGAGGGAGGAGGAGVTITTGPPVRPAGGGGGSNGRRPVVVTFKPPASPQHPEGLPF